MSGGGGFNFNLGNHVHPCCEVGTKGTKARSSFDSNLNIFARFFNDVHGITFFRKDLNNICKVHVLKNVCKNKLHT